MRDRDFELLFELEEHYWWFRAMREITDAILAPVLRRPGLRILDAGCGTGFNLGHYAEADASRCVYGLDIADAAIRYLRKRGFRNVAQASITDIPFPAAAFDLVFSFDVLTQTPREMHHAALSEMQRVLKPGGRLFIRVPAFMWLWSSHDEEIQTRYRYTRAELVKRLENAGFAVEWSSYANGVLFPVVLARRLLKRIGLGGGTDVKPLPRGLRWVDGVFYRALASEARRFKSGRRLPVGLSVICYCRRRL